MRHLELEQGSPEWKSARIGKITGTKAKDALGTKTAKENLLNNLIAEQLTEKIEEIRITDDMQRGIDEESFAIREYTNRTGIKVKDDFGLCVHDQHEWLAVSPDGFTEDLKHAVEVKCPKTKTQIKYLRSGEIPKEYKNQVIQYFLVNEDLETLDFITYDPRIKLESLQLNIVSVTREDLQEDIEKSMKGLLDFRELWEAEHERLTF